jgi:hypothetical protein
LNAPFGSFFAVITDIMKNIIKNAIGMVKKPDVVKFGIGILLIFVLENQMPE